MLRAREVRERLKGKVKPDVLVVLESLAEDNSLIRQQLDYLAKNLDQMAGILAQFVDIADNMKSAVEGTRKMRGIDDEPVQ